MNRNFKTVSDDLDYLAEAGHERVQFNRRDYREISSHIDAVAGISTFFSFFMLILALFLPMFTTLFFLFSLRGEKAHVIPRVQTKNTTIYKKQNTGILFPKEITSPVNAINQKKFLKENFISSTVLPSLTEKLNRQETVEDMKLLHVPSVAAESVNSLQKSAIYNAPVYNIQGFKITNYEAYYFKSGQPFMISPKGQPANTITSPEWKEKEHQVSAVAILNDALASISSANYPAALQQFQELLELNPEDVNAIFYSGLSSFLSMKYRQAISFFLRVENLPNTVFHEESRYYHAMALHDSGEKQEARIIFQEIVQQNGFYSGRAAEWLK